jgi:hypothetical protein
MAESNEIKTEHVSSTDKEEPVTEEHQAILRAERAAALQSPPGKYGGVAYQILLLQQRLESYERLHREEMAELRQELDQLRRTFLEETNPQLRAIKIEKEQRSRSKE